ncbi:major facilitator superfamily domain-containing protein [Mortierella sp. GBAus27b]|nr:major facilitator superfamily domain-containing protein [Mortierella sp. GBAus27b]
MEGKILDYPEGGFGWLVVLASFVVNFWGFAPNITYGVYLDHFFKAGAFNGAAQTQLSWVGSIGTAAMFLPGPFVAPMTMFLGLRAVVAIGITVASLGFILASFATQLWHLYLTQGLLFGIGGGIVFFCSIAVTAQYFEKRRGLANGIAVAGSGIGGLILAPITRLLIAQVGVQWCQRIIGFCILGFMGAIFPFIRPRVTPVRRGAIFDLSLFKIPSFRWLLLTAFVVTFGYMVPIFLIPTYVTQELHEAASTGANLISLFSGINAVSRIGLGVAADKLGRTNTLFTCCFLAGASVLAIWSVSSNIVILTVFMVFYGLFGGGFISIFPVVVAQVVGVERLSAALGILYFGNAVGNLLGAPIATAIRASQGGKYTGAIVFAGLTPVLAAMFVLFVRFRINKKIFAIA